MTRVDLNAVVAAAPARVVVTRDAAGGVREAAFDLSGLPRVDALLTGRPVTEVPGLVERLCSICPVVHHLAGVRALESLAGVTVPPTAQAVRRLLHHAGVIGVHAMGLFAAAPAAAVTLRRFAKAVQAATGSPGHFPVTAVPGGVVAPVDGAQVAVLREAVPGAVAAAQAVADQCDGRVAPEFGGADLALVDETGGLDLFGVRLRAVAADGAVLVPAALPAQWDDLVAETRPGETDPRPYLVGLGPAAGSYRVGPVAQLRVGTVSTPLAAGRQQAWATRGGAEAARAIVTLHAVEVIAALLDDPALTAGTTAAPWPAVLPAGVGVGWVDGARGLLIHRYATTADARVAAATILTPTAQNEAWLGSLLASAVAADSPEAARHGVEAAIREADPCLPCATAAPGSMDLVVDQIKAG